ncbi:MAG: O-antigen ligase family protein [Anaerolineales bacterium]
MLRDYYYTHPRMSAFAVGVALAVTAAGVGALLGYTGPIITLAVLAALGAGVLAFGSLEVGFWGVVAVITLLPFATLPFKLILTPTFLDLALGAVMLVYAVQWMAGYRRNFMTTPAHAPIIAFIVLAVFAFVLGLRNGPLTSNLLRKFAEFVLSIGFALVVVDYVRTRERLRGLVRIVLIAGTAAALIAIVLYALPPTLSQRALNALGVVGYPTGAVLRYIEDNPENAQRAIGTSVDPNAFGGLMAMIGALAAPQLVTRRPLFGRRWIAWAAFGLIIAALILTFSRAAMAGLVAGMLLIALARYRRLLLVLALGGGAIALLPATQAYVLRFVEGIQFADLATQMRVGEYRDAFTLLGRYPVVGVGFAGAPDIDIYLGVANAYLTLAEEMGFVGLAMFIAVVAVIFGWALVHRRAALHDRNLAATWLGLYAGLVAALMVGFFDHYFVNLEFQPAQTIFWLYVGLALAATRQAASRAAAPD